MASGTVKWFNTAKGFGFIQPDDGGSDVFVHISAVEQAGLRGLNEGDQVNFELEQDRRSGKLSAGQLVVTGQGARPARGGGGGGGFDRPRGGGLTRRRFRRRRRRFGGGGGSTVRRRRRRRTSRRRPGRRRRRHGEVVQPHQGLRLHPARRRRPGRVRAHLGGRAGRSARPERRPDGRLRPRGRTAAAARPRRPTFGSPARIRTFLLRSRGRTLRPRTGPPAG